MSVFRIPAAPTTTDQPETDERRGLDGNGTMRASDLPVHWMAGESSMTWNNPVTAIACGGEGAFEYTLTKVTCAECLNVVIRRRCLALEDAPGPLRQRCTRPLHGDERHSWRWDSAGLPGLSSTEPDSPSDRLPVRVPGEALREAEEAAVSEFESEGGTSGPDESAGPGASAFRRRAERAREVIETWPA